MKIVVTKRSDDVCATADGMVGVWGCGKTIDSAIGDLIRVHSKALGIEISGIDEVTERLVAEDERSHK